MIRKKKILFLSSWFPIPADNGSKLRIYNLLRGLSIYYDVTLISFDDNPTTDKNSGEIKSICNEVKTIPVRRFNPKSFKAGLGFLSLTPRAFIDTYSYEMEQRIKDTIAAKEPDLVIASQLGTAVYRQSFKRQPALFEEVEIGLYYDLYKNAGSSKKRLRNRLTWMKHRRYLANLVRSYQSCTVVSDREKELLQIIHPNNTITKVIPNCVNINDYQEVRENPQSDMLIFTGSFTYYPNYEAIIWFIENVFPRVQAYCPLIKLMITGNQGSRPVPPLANVTLTGFVEDVRPLIARSSISVVPIISGGGTRLKILEAMALHTPVVTTRKGAEGLDVTHGLNILLAETPDEFAGNIINLLNDPDKRQKQANNAFQLVQEKYEWSGVMPRFINWVESTINLHNSKYSGSY